MNHEKQMETMAVMQTRVKFLESQIRGKQEGNDLLQVNFAITY